MPHASTGTQAEDRHDAAPGSAPQFGNLLKRYRLATGLTQHALAERSGMSARGISDLERGVRCVPQKSTVVRLASALPISALDRLALEASAQQQRRPATDLLLTAPSAKTSTPAPGRERRVGAGVLPLVGRGRDMALLERHLRGEGPPVLLLAGEPGIGKTRLLDEVARSAAQRNRRVLRAGCLRPGGQGPYAPILEALESHIRYQSSDGLRADLTGCFWLKQLFPELMGWAIDAVPYMTETLPPEQVRRLLFTAVTRFLANIAGTYGVVLLLDDLQWAGLDALALLGALARAAAEIPLRIVGAYRDTEVDEGDPLWNTLGELAQAGLAVHAPVQPLNATSAHQLLDALLQEVPDRQSNFRDTVLERSGGVPFFLVSYAQSLQLPTADTEEGSRVPWDLRQSIRRRVAALPPVGREALAVAATVGRKAPYDLLFAMIAAPQEEVVHALDLALRARLLRYAGDDGCEFVHDVIREVVEADLGAARLKILHRRLAEIMSQHRIPPSSDVLAYHFMSGDAQPEAIVYLERAGDHAQVQGANGAAEAHFRELVQRLDAIDRPLDAARAREKLGAVLGTEARYTAALQVLGEAEDRYRMAGDIESVRRVTAQIGWVHADRGQPEEGVLRLKPLLHLLEASQPSHGLAALYVALARLLYGSGRFKEQLIAADRAVALANALNDHVVLVRALASRGYALWMMERLEEALPVLEEAGRMAEAVHDVDTLSRTLAGQAVVYMYRGDIHSARGCTERSLAVAERLGDPVQIAYAVRNRGCIALFRGEWSQARADFEQSLALNRNIGASWGFGAPLASLGLLCALEGRTEEAQRYLDECREVAEAGNDLAQRRMVQWMLAERDLISGDSRAAYARLSPFLKRPGLEEMVDPILLKTLAWAGAEVGEMAGAIDAATRAVSCARAGNDVIALAHALQVQALVATRSRQWAEAAHVLNEGLALTRSMPYPHVEARILRVWALYHAEQGAPEEAHRCLEAALAIFEQLGAHVEARHAANALTVSQSRWPGWQ
jgi:tetratricopeptide (TPR) repeat protein/transcriptional regulator with XRE-family HTH domain